MSKQGHESRHRVLVVGGGFGGLQAAMKLSREDVEITLVDRRNFHLFQPLAYQVATGGLSPGEIAYPLRAIFKRRPNVRVLLGEVTGFDLDARRVTIAAHEHAAEPRTETYDSLVVAGGSQYSYFGHEEWAGLAPELKSMESLLTVRRRILGAFEAAELETDEALRRAWLTFVVVGGGPTGVEMAGQIGEIARDTLKRDFREIDPREARILLAEASDRLLTTFPPSLSAKAERSLAELGVTTLTGHLVVGLGDESVTMTMPDGQRLVVPARTAIWAAGVTASPLARMLGEASGTELDRAGRLPVGPELTVAGHPEVFAIGDMVRPPAPVPGVAPAAMQEGRYAAKAIRERLRGRDPAPFRYVDKGNVATIGRARAVADLHGIHLSGFPAWVFWLALHLYYLIGFENRLLVLIRWLVSFATRGRGARLITGDVTTARDERPLEHSPV
jgi:NADH:ubiquinone reductase (H+-translocating)